MSKKWIKGYKGFNKDLTCQGYQFEVGKIHVHDGEIKICEAGFHFCEQTKDVESYYSSNNAQNRFFEIEATDAVRHGNKSVAKTIKLIKEISFLNIRSGYGNGYGYGYGNGYGYGYGNGYGYGYGYGYGHGDGNGDGHGDGNGDGYGYGYGDGDGDGHGDGNGNGDGYGHGDYYIFSYIKKGIAA